MPDSSPAFGGIFQSSHLHRVTGSLQHKNRDAIMIYATTGNTIRVEGGRLDGQVGEDIKDNGCRIAMVSCQTF